MRGKWNQKLEHQRAIDVLQTVLDGREDPERAAALLASIYNPLLKQRCSLSPVHQLWDIVCSSIRMLGGNVAVAERLISLLNALANLQDVTVQSDLAKEGFKGVYWKDLPSLAIAYRETALGMLLILVHTGHEAMRLCCFCALTFCVTFATLTSCRPLGCMTMMPILVRL